MTPMIRNTRPLVKGLSYPKLSRTPQKAALISGLGAEIWSFLQGATPRELLLKLSPLFLSDPL